MADSDEDLVEREIIVQGEANKGEMDVGRDQEEDIFDGNNEWCVVYEKRTATLWNHEEEEQEEEEDATAQTEQELGSLELSLEERETEEEACNLDRTVYTQELDVNIQKAVAEDEMMESGQDPEVTTVCAAVTDIIISSKDLSFKKQCLSLLDVDHISSLKLNLSSRLSALM